MPPDTTKTTGPKPTLRTIAELSGLAVPTVSRALNDAPDIGAETKARVRRIAAEIGYVPNRAGVRLRTGRTNVISVIMTTDADLTNHTGRFVGAVAQGLQGSAFHMNYTPYLGAADRMRPVRYIVETGSADAVILDQIEPGDPRVEYLIEKGFPFVTHGRTDWSDSHPYYDVCNHDVGRVGVEFLARRGRRELLLIAPPAEQSYGRAMREGASEAAGQAGVNLIIDPQVTSHAKRPELLEVLGRRLAESPRIDGVLTASCSAAMSATAAIEAAGRRLGEGIDLFSKETTDPLLALFRPQIHFILEDVTRAGDFCARAAMQRVRDPSAPPMQFLRHIGLDEVQEGRV